jgi:malonyl-CoA O-methyltransferase
MEGHRLWAASYDAGPNPLLALESRALGVLLGPVDSLAVVDVACGTGRWAERLAQSGARVTGVDVCEPMLVRAAGKRALAGRVILADAGLLPLASEIADVTLCSFAAAYIADLRRAVSEMARITRPGGIVAISDFHPLAAAAGWTRSFRAGGRAYRMEHFARSAAQLRSLAAAAGLALELQMDAHFGEPERGIFIAAGKGAIFAALRETPAVWIGIWEKL